MAHNNNRSKTQGIRPEYKAQKTRKAIFGAVKACIGLAVLGLIVGAALVYKDHWWGLLFGKDDKKVTQAAPPPLPTRPSQTALRVEPPPVEKVQPPPLPEKMDRRVEVPPPLPTGEEETAKKLIDQGRAALEKFQFDAAKAVFHQAASKKAGTLIEEAKTWEKKSDQFHTAIKHIPVAEFATSDSAFLIETHDGTELRGLKLDEDGEQVKFQRIDNPASTGQIKIPIDKADIKAMLPLSRETRQEEFTGLLKGLTSKGSFQRSTDFYDLVYLARRLNLGHECIDFLNRAFDGNLPERQPDPYLGDSFRKEVIRREIDRASLLLAAGRNKRFVDDVLNRLLKTLPDYQVAQDEVEAFRTAVLSKVRDLARIHISEPTRP